MGPELAPALAAIGMGSLYAVPVMSGGVCVGSVGIAPAPCIHVRPAGPRPRAALRVASDRSYRQPRLTQSLETLAESVPAIVLRTEPAAGSTGITSAGIDSPGRRAKRLPAGAGKRRIIRKIFCASWKSGRKRSRRDNRSRSSSGCSRYDGVYHWHLARVEPVRDDKGTIISWYGTVVDIEAQKAALERTKRVAETLQKAFLPRALPQRASLRFDATYVSAEEDALVGGDWYDAFEMPDGRLGFSIGDVAGHGIEARSPSAICAKRSIRSRFASTIPPRFSRKPIASYACKNPGRSLRRSSASSTRRR